MDSKATKLLKINDLNPIGKLAVGVSHQLALQTSTTASFEHWTKEQVQQWMIDCIHCDDTTAKLGLYSQTDGRTLAAKWKEGFQSILVFLVDLYGFKDVSILQKVIYQIEHLQKSQYIG